MSQNCLKKRDRLWLEALMERLAREAGYLKLSQRHCHCPKRSVPVTDRVKEGEEKTLGRELSREVLD